MARRSSYRLLAQLVTVGTSLLSGAFVARRLGGDGKGAVASLSYLGALAAPLAGLGLGEAAVTLVRLRDTPLAVAVRSNIAVLLVTSVASGLAVFGLASAMFADRWSEFDGSIAAAVAAATLWSFVMGMLALLEALDRPAVTSLIRIAMAITVLVMTAVLVGPLRLSVLGGVAADLIGWALGAVLIVVVLRRTGLSARPAADHAYLRRALRLGIPIQLATLLAVAATRLDLLLVQGLRDDTAAGMYSVAINASYLLVFPAAAIAVASHPTLAGLDPGSARELLARLSRSTVLLTVATATVLAAVLPLAVPLLFGSGFSKSLPPTFVLLIGGVFAGEQLLLARCLVARGSPMPFVWGYATSVVVMVGVDLVLVPTAGIVGAAIGSSCGSAAGLAVVLATARREHVLPPFRDLVPRAADVSALATTGRRALRRRV